MSTAHPPPVPTAWHFELPDATAQALRARAHRRRYPDGALLYARGDAPDGLYCVHQGRVRVGAVSAGGKGLVLTILETGSWFGEISLFDNQPRSHDVWALGPTEVEVVPTADFLNCLDNDRETHRHLTALLCQRVRLLMEAYEESLWLSLPARLAKRLLSLARVYGEPDADGVRLDLHLTQETLAQMFGAARQSVSKQLKAWERAGWLRLAYGGVVLRHPKELQAVVDRETR